MLDSLDVSDQCWQRSKEFLDSSYKTNDLYLRWVEVPLTDENKDNDLPWLLKSRQQHHLELRNIPTSIKQKYTAKLELLIKAEIKLNSLFEEYHKTGKLNNKEVNERLVWLNKKQEFLQKYKDLYGRFIHDFAVRSITYEKNSRAFFFMKKRYSSFFWYITFCI
jgi:hypothetical protein